MYKRLFLMIGFFVVCGCNVEIDADVPMSESCAEGKIPETCQCDGSEPGNDGEHKAIVFGDVCAFSGGKLNKDGQCVCGDELCPEGVVCISDVQNKPECAVKLKASECADGEKFCKDDSVLGCMDGQWAVVETCEGNAHVCSEGACVVCVDGMTKCEADKEYVCQEGAWTLSKTCDDYFGCYEDKYCNECRYKFETGSGILAVDQDQCLGDHILGKCKDGKLNPQLCEDEGLCRFDKKEDKPICMVCSDEKKDVKQDFTYLQMCIDGAWGDSVKCEYGVQSQPVCKTCEFGDSICFAEKSLDTLKAYVCEDSFWVLRESYSKEDCKEIYVKTSLE